MKLSTQRLCVRSAEAADASAIAALWTDPQVTQYLGGPRDGTVVTASLIDDVARMGAPFLAVLPIVEHATVEHATGNVVGHCGLIPKEIDRAHETELIYVMAQRAWGKGYATEAASALMEHAYESMGVTRLVALIDPANTASERVAVKLGMRHEHDTLRPSGKVLRVYARERQRTNHTGRPV